MKYRLLIFDDDYLARKKAYNRLSKGHRDLPFNFETVGVTNLGDFKTALKGHAFDAVLLDVVLSSNESLAGEIISQAIGAVPTELPIAYISGRWVGAAFDVLRQIWETRPLKYAFSLRELADEDNWPAVLVALESMIRSAKGASSLLLEDGQPLRLIHLSDFHFGMGIGADDAKIIDDSLTRLDIIRYARKYWPNPPRDGVWPILFAVTGDFANKGAKGEFKLAEAWLRKTLGRFNLPIPSDRLLLTPGNHDCFLPLEAADRLRCNPDGPNKIEVALPGEVDARQSFPKMSFFNFYEFAQSVSSAAYWRSHDRDSWVDSRYVNLGVVFFGINSAQGISVDSMKSSEVDSAALVELADKLDSIDPNVMRIGLVHNPPDPEGGASESSFVKPVDKFRSYNFDHFRTDLWLHGHVHEFNSRLWLGEDGRRSIVVGAAAPRNPKTKQELDETRGFSFIEILRDAVGGVRVDIKSFQYQRGQVREAREKRYEKKSDQWSEGRIRKLPTRR